MKEDKREKLYKSKNDLYKKHPTLAVSEDMVLMLGFGADISHLVWGLDS